MAYSVKIDFTITKDGNPFHSTNLNYDNLSYEQVVEFEKFGAKTVAELTKWGEAQVAVEKAETGKGK